MYIAFRTLDVKPDLRNRLAGVWTGSDITHCELLFTTPYPVAVAARSGSGVTPMPASASMGDGTGWTFFEVPLANENDAYQFCAGQFGARFNYKGIAATQVFGWSVAVPNEWFCSELCYAVAKNYGVIVLPVYQPAQVSPVMLYSMLLRAGLTPTEYPPF